MQPEFGQTARAIQLIYYRKILKKKKKKGKGPLL
jgi:hypothetical protein